MAFAGETPVQAASIILSLRRAFLGVGKGRLSRGSEVDKLHLAPFLKLRGGEGGFD